MKNGKHENSYLQNDWNKLVNKNNVNGEEIFDFFVVEECVPYQLCEKEQYYLDKYFDVLNIDGKRIMYNICKKSERPPKFNEFSIEKQEELRKKYSERSKGRIHSEETKKKMREKRKNNKKLSQKGEQINIYFPVSLEIKKKLQYQARIISIQINDTITYLDIIKKLIFGYLSGSYEIKNFK